MTKAKNDKSLIVGLDIGTSKVVAIVGEYAPGETVEVIGIGSHASHGLKRGVVVDIESTVQSIQRAVEEAELMAGCEIRSVYAGISGSHINGRNSHGTAPIRDREVMPADVEHVLDAACAVAIPADQRVLYKEPQGYIIDGQEDIRHPVGMSGVRLEANVHIVTGAVSAAQNITKCVNVRRGRRLICVSDRLEQAILCPRTRTGVCIVDVGAGTTDIAIFQGAIRHTASLPIGGDQVTNDIAQVSHPTAHAEEIKVKYACALRRWQREETIRCRASDVHRGAWPGRRWPNGCSHATRLFGMVQARCRSGYESLVAGIVLTGRARWKAVELAEKCSTCRCRACQHVTGLADVSQQSDPPPASAAALRQPPGKQCGFRSRPGIGGVGGAWERVLHWFKGVLASRTEGAVGSKRIQPVRALRGHTPVHRSRRAGAAAATRNLSTTSGGWTCLNWSKTHPMR